MYPFNFLVDIYVDKFKPASYLDSLLVALKSQNMACPMMSPCNRSTIPRPLLFTQFDTLNMVHALRSVRPAIDRISFRTLFSRYVKFATKSDNTCDLIVVCGA